MSDLCDVISENEEWRSVISARVSPQPQHLDRVQFRRKRTDPPRTKTIDNKRNSERDIEEESQTDYFSSGYYSNDNDNENYDLKRSSDDKEKNPVTSVVSSSSGMLSRSAHPESVSSNYIYEVDDGLDDHKWEFTQEVKTKELSLKRALNNVRNTLKDTLSMLKEKERRIVQLEETLKRLRSKSKATNNGVETVLIEHHKRGQNGYSEELDRLRHENRSLKRELENETVSHRITRNERDIAADSAEDLRLKFQKLKEDYDIILCTTEHQKETLDEFKNYREGVKGKYEEQISSMDIKYQSLSNQCNDLKRIKGELEDDLSRSQRKHTEMKIEKDYHVSLESAEVRKLQLELLMLEEKMHASHLCNIRLIRIMANTTELGQWMRMEYGTTGNVLESSTSFADYIFIPPNEAAPLLCPPTSSICARCSSIIIPGSSDGDIYSGNYHNPNYITTRSKNTYLNGTLYPRRTGIGISRNGSGCFLTEDIRSQQDLCDAMREEEAYFNEFSLTDAGNKKMRETKAHHVTSGFSERAIQDPQVLYEGISPGLAKATPSNCFREDRSCFVHLDSKTAQRKARLLAATLSSMIDLKTESDYWIPHAAFVEAQKFRGALAANIIAAAIAAYNTAASSSASKSPSISGSSFNLFDDLLPVSAFFSFFININTILRNRVASRDTRSRGGGRRNNSVINTNIRQNTARDSFPSSVISSSSQGAHRRDNGINVSSDNNISYNIGSFTADMIDGSNLSSEDLTLLRRVDRDLSDIRKRLTKLPKTAKVGDFISQYEGLVVKPYQLLLRKVVFSQQEKDKELRHCSQIPGGGCYISQASNPPQGIHDEVIISKLHTLKREIAKISKTMRESLCGAGQDVQRFLAVTGDVLAETLEREENRKYQLINGYYSDDYGSAMVSEYEIEEDGKEALIPLIHRVMEFMTKFAIEVDRNVMEATERLERVTVDILT